MRVTHRVLSVAAVVALTMLGNLRSQASEAGRTRSDAQSLPLLHEDAPRRVDAASATTNTIAAQDDTEPGADDALRLVPAIYAWDPDVRFVYYRHVSKWM